MQPNSSLSRKTVIEPNVGYSYSGLVHYLFEGLLHFFPYPAFTLFEKTFKRDFCLLTIESPQCPGAHAFYSVVSTLLEGTYQVRNISYIKAVPH